MNHGSPPRLPLSLKVTYTLFLAVLVPFYWINYGPQNFLWFCDIALFLTLPALWWENRLLASMPAVGIILPQLSWIADFFVRLFTGSKFIGIAEYMFDPNIPLFVRGLSSFHGWLPVLLAWMVWKLGYDRRALLAQTAVGSLALVLSFLLTDRPRPSLAGVAAGSVGMLISESAFTWPGALAILDDFWRHFDKPNSAVNVNWVFGFGQEVQTMMNPTLFLAIQIVLYPLCIYIPTHYLLRWLVPPGRATEAVSGTEIREITDGDRIHRAGQQPGRPA